jgi:polyisoprenoid-binding protein YceI
MTTQRWTIDPSHSGVHFSVRHMVISKVRGAFQRWQGTIDFDEANPSTSKVSVRIEANSIDTREPKRDAHLRSADFFDVEHHPALTFESTEVAKVGDDRYSVTGDLTIRGVTRSIVLAAELLGAKKDPWGKRRIAFGARTSINRKEFGLNWNQGLEAGGVLVGEQIEIDLDVEAVEAELAAQAA